MGLSLFLFRSLCGRIAEARKVINLKENSAVYADLWDGLSTSEEALVIRRKGEAARKALNKRLGPSSALVQLVRDKLAYHLDQAVLDRGFADIPPDFSLADFHTGVHGTTFFGISDTAAAVAVAHMIGKAPGEAINAMVDEALAATSELQEFANAFMLAFYQHHFGLERIRSGRRVRLQNLPDMERATLGFFMAMPRGKRRPVLGTSPASPER